MFLMAFGRFRGTGNDLHDVCAKRLCGCLDLRKKDRFEAVHNLTHLDTFSHVLTRLDTSYDLQLIHFVHTS